jgi:protein involved in ribonucleotide reduction
MGADVEARFCTALPTPLAGLRKAKNIVPRDMTAFLKNDRHLPCRAVVQVLENFTQYPG